MNKLNPIGLGSTRAQIHLYIANRPMIDHYPQLCHLQSLVAGEIAHITRHTSNHWRKVFNVYAKFLKTYAARLSFPSLLWIDEHFAINRAHRLIVSPYPDYRQLSNMRIAQLIDIMRSLDSPEKAK